MRSKAEIGEAIAKLTAMRPHIVPRSGFGDDNLAGLDAQLRVLEKQMSEDDVNEHWDREGDSYVRDAAAEAAAWLAGEDNDEAFDWPLKQH